MATWYLINNVRVGTNEIVAGTLVNDAIEDAATIRACGGVLCPSSHSGVAAAAVIADGMRRRGIDHSEIADVMQAAYEQDEAGDSLTRDGLTSMLAIIPFATTAATAGMQQTALATVGTGTAMVVRAQAATAVGAGANVGGSLTVGGGSSSGGVASNTGGATNVDTGVGATANGVLNLQTGGVTRLTLAGAGNQLAWAVGAGNVSIVQGNRTTVGAAPSTTIGSSSATVAGAAGNTGGNLSLVTGVATNDGSGAAVGGDGGFVAGDASISAGGAVAVTGGGMTVRAGNATGFGAAGACTGGNLILSAGNAATGATNTGGNVTVSTGTGATAVGTFTLNLGAAAAMTVVPTSITVAPVLLQWAAASASVTISQQTLAAGGTGAAWVIAAQPSAVAGGANVGGALTQRAGLASNNGTGASTGGELIVAGGDAAQTANGVVVTTGGNATFRAGNGTGFGAGAGGATVGGNLNLAAGDAATGLTNTGGNAILASGAGATAVGSVTIRTGGVGGTVRFTADATGIGFFAHATAAQPNIVGAKADAVAGALVQALATLGLVIDSTT